MNFNNLIKKDIVVTSLILNRPVMILGEAGSGKYQLARQAIKFLKSNFLELDLKVCSRMIEEYSDVMAPTSRSMIAFQQKIDKDLDSILLYSNFEYARVEWACHVFSQIMFDGRKTIIVGTDPCFTPLMDRFQVVRM